jgi:CSLREA domain-containing protein
MKPRMLALLANSLILFALVISPCAAPAHAEPQTTFTVTANTDIVDATPGDGVCETAPGNGMCTLRAAIMEANVHIGADTILLPAATYALTIPGANEDLSATGDLDVTESLTITGDGSGDTIIEAAGLGDRVLEVWATAAAVTLSGLTLQHGTNAVGSGGGIANRTDLTLEDIRLYRNDASNFGGGIWNLHTLILKNVTIEQNTAVTGGGIYTNAALDAEDSNILDNTTQAEGGGLYMSSASKGDLVRTNVVGNTAGSSGGNIYTSGTLSMEESYIANGTAAAMGGGMFIESLTTTLTQVSITENHAAHAGGIAIGEGAKLTGTYLVFDANTAEWNGGAIQTLDGDLTLYYSTLSENSADAGGAIFTNANSEVTISASSIISNTAIGYGGGVFSIGSMSLKQVTLSANHAHDGGGVYNNGELWIENSTLSGNSSTANGGGLYDLGGFFTAIYNSTITANLAGATALPPGGVGGGVYDTEPNLSLRNTILSGNRHRQLVNFVDDDCYGGFHSGDYNLIGTLSNCAIWEPVSHDLVGEDPLLGELADNGGATYTYALLEGSPAIDGGNPAGCKGIDDILLYFDQRGVNRPQDGDKDGSNVCDIGAYELFNMSTLYLPFMVK